MSEEFDEYDDEENENAKKVFYLFRKAPHGNINPYEGLEVILIMAAYDQDITLGFMDDGVQVLKKGQDTSGIGVKEFSATFRVMEDYDVEKVFVDRESLEDRGLTAEDLVIPVEIKERREMLAAMKENEVLLPF